MWGGSTPISFIFLFAQNIAFLAWSARYLLWSANISWVGLSMRRIMLPRYLFLPTFSISLSLKLTLNWDCLYIYNIVDVIVWKRLIGHLKISDSLDGDVHWIFDWPVFKTFDGSSPVHNADCNKDLFHKVDRAFGLQSCNIAEFSKRSLPKGLSWYTFFPKC